MMNNSIFGVMASVAMEMLSSPNIASPNLVFDFGKMYSAVPNVPPQLIQVWLLRPPCPLPLCLKGSMKNRFLTSFIAKCIIFSICHTTSSRSSYNTIGKVICSTGLLRLCQ
eukprot:13581315-Ditylum_brightwellii.AAC.1